MNAMTETIALERTGAEMGIRVLLIEDDADLCAAISDYLAKQGIAVLVEGRGDRALARISEVKPDLVILDVMLPGKDTTSALNRV